MFSNNTERVSRRYAASLSPALARWQESEGSWFDGSPQSVDKRIAQCRALQSGLRGAAGALAGTAGAVRYIAAEQSLAADRRALAQLRRDLLTAAADRESAPAPEPRQVRLPKAARRWVEAEARQFLREQAGGADRRELAERARRHAATETSALPPGRAAAVTAAFVASVLAGHRPTRVARRAAAPQQDFPDQLLHC